MRRIKYSKAINEAQHQAMQKDTSVFHIGVGIDTPWYVGQTMKGLLDTYGIERFIDPPVSENGITGLAIGAAAAGMRPIITFPRMDFMYYAMDQICNHAAVLNYSLGGNFPLPLTIRAIINRKGEQAAQHSQALQGLFMHIPGLKIVMPSDAYEAKGMLTAAIEDNNPVIYIDDKELYNEECEVPEAYYAVPLNTAKILIEGKDITMVSSSYMLSQSKKAVEELKKKKLSVELIDLRSVKPIDSVTIINSVKKTGRLIVVDGGWATGGVASEVIAIITTNALKYLKSSPVRLALPDLPAPATYVLENAYYPDVNKIISVVEQYLIKK